VLRDEYRQQAESQLQELEAREGLGFAWRNPGEVEQKAMALFDQAAPAAAERPGGSAYRECQKCVRNSYLT
jgi:hypothetical protein